MHSFKKFKWKSLVVFKFKKLVSRIYRGIQAGFFDASIRASLSLTLKSYLNHIKEQLIVMKFVTILKNQ